MLEHRSVLPSFRPVPKESETLADDEDDIEIEFN
jgi:hypothetical protein